MGGGAFLKATTTKAPAALLSKKVEVMHEQQQGRLGQQQSQSINHIIIIATKRIHFQ